MTCEDGKCPICQSPTSREIIKYVEQEIENFSKDPNYKVKPFGERHEA